jgi:large subunit ribosomal protein L2
MSVKKIKPNTPGQRFRISPDFSELTGHRPHKPLLVPLKKRGGRNNTGKMTMRYIGGGHKQKVRIIDTARKKYDVPGTVQTIEYDPNRSAFISLIRYADGEKLYILAPKGLKVGTQIIAGKQVAPEVGNAMPLMAMPLGTIIHNIALHPNKGGAMVRSAGTSAQILGREGKYVSIKMPSGETRQVLGTCTATVGVVSNSSHNNTRDGKAGRNRWKGRRPRTRPVAMNPVDHPMGGGEGKASGGHPRSRTGLLAKGKVTRKRKKYSDPLILKKRKK